MKKWEVDLVTPGQYADPYNAVIRRELLEKHSASRLDYYGWLFETLETKGDERILNIGSGDGRDEVRWIKEFGHQGEIVSMEVPIDRWSHDHRFYAAQEELREAGKRSFTIAQGIAEDIPFEDNSFDIVTILQVLYQTNVLAALKDISRVLKPGGKLQATTNGRRNKPKHHKFIKKIGKKSRSRPPAPLSAPFNLERQQRVIPIQFELIRPIRQTDLIVVDDEESMRAYTASIDTYRPSFDPVISADDWKEIRTAEVDRKIETEIESSGRFTDDINRGGGNYINTKRQTKLGNIAMRVMLNI